MKFGTKTIHAGQKPDPTTGAIMTPVYQTSTYIQSSPGQHSGFEYSRTGNPTRKVLEDNPNRWTVMTFHHPVFSPGSDRDNIEIRELWKPLIDEFKVDLVLSGHDHSYARTGQVDTEDLVNVPTGYQQAYDPEIGTVYVVSVSGPKMYGITKGNYAKRVAENTQLYQIIHIDDNEYPPVERFIRCEYKQSDWEWAREKHGIPSKVQYKLKSNRL